jgi:hypothetical protein
MKRKNLDFEGYFQNFVLTPGSNHSAKKQPREYMEKETGRKEQDQRDNCAGARAMPEETPGTRKGAFPKQTSALARGREQLLLAARRLPFPGRLHALLESAEAEGLDHIVSWSLDGKSFKVHDSKKFCQYCCQLFFRNQTQYKSFQRQLHLYGFIRMPKGPNKGSCHHKLFVRSNKNLCLQMKPLSRQKEEEASSQDDHFSLTMLDKKGQHQETRKTSFAGPPIDGKDGQIVLPPALFLIQQGPVVLSTHLPQLQQHQSILGTPTTTRQASSFERIEHCPLSPPPSASLMYPPPLFVGNQQQHQDRPPPQEISVLNQRGASLVRMDLSSANTIPTTIPPIPHSGQRCFPSSIQSIEEEDHQGETKEKLKRAPAVDNEDGAAAEWFSNHRSPLFDSFDERISEVLHNSAEEQEGEWFCVLQSDHNC